MNLLDGIKLYCHIMQQSGGGIMGRNNAIDALQNHNISPEIINAIAASVSNDGHLISGKGGTFALTQISAS